MAEAIPDWAREEPSVPDWAKEESPNWAKEPSWGETAWDVAKQVPSGVVAGVEHLATGPARLMGLAGRGLEAIGLGGDPERAAEQRKIRELAAVQGGAGGVGQYLPQPETTAGKYARTASEFLPAGAVQPGSLLRRGAEAAGAGIVSEAAGQATEGTELEPWARAAGAIVGGYPVAKAAQIGQNLRRFRGSPTSEMLEASSNRSYTSARELNVPYNPNRVSNLQRGINQELLQKGYRPGHGMSTFDRIAELTWEGGKPPNFSDIESVRKALNRIAGERNPHPPFGPSENAGAAKMAIDRIDAFLVNPNNALPGFRNEAEQTAALALRARGDWAAKSRSQSIERAVETGELSAGATGSGANIDNRLRQQARNILSNPKRLRGYTAEDKAMIREIATGTIGRNIARYLGKGTPTGIVSAAGIEYLAHALGLGPMGHAATLGAAYAGKKAADIGTKLAYKRLLSNIRADSPLGRSMDIPSPGLPPSSAAALLRGEIGAQGGEGRLKGGRVTKSFYWRGGRI